jgi:hypothetical protein
LSAGFGVCGASGVVEVGIGQRPAFVDRFNNLAQTLDGCFRASTDLPWVRASHRIDIQRLDNDQTGTALRARPVVRHVTRRDLAVLSAKGGLHWREARRLGIIFCPTLSGENGLAVICDRLVKRSTFVALAAIRRIMSPWK